MPVLDLLADAHKIRRYKNCYVYEIYPQSPVPQLTRIAHLYFSPARDPIPYSDSLPNRVIWYNYDESRDRMVFRVWDYRLNQSICFSVDLAGDKCDNWEVVVIPIFSKRFF